jgi:hypothetical protein
VKQNRIGAREISPNIAGPVFLADHVKRRLSATATSNSTVYDLLARHGWRKLMPRPFHPKRDVAAQDAFKKTAFLVL